MNDQAWIARREWLLTTRVLASIAFLALAIGAAGALAANLYLRHSEQHRVTEQFMRDQQQFNQQLISAIQQLSTRK